MNQHGEILNIRLLEEGEVNRWDDFVLSHEMGTLYHTSLWRQLIEKVFGYRGLFLVLEDNKGSIRGGLPIFFLKNKMTTNRLSCVPCAQFCNPLVGSQEDYDQVCYYIIDLIRRENMRYIELKTHESFKLNSTKFGTELFAYSTYRLDTSKTAGEIFRSFHKDCVQRPIKKAGKNGLELLHGASLADVEQFYRLYLAMRKTHGLLPLPAEFFSQMVKTMAGKDCLDILFAKHQNTIVSSVLLLKYKDTVTYEYGATLPETFKLHPSQFLLWEAIKGAIIKGYRIFDFGRTANDNQSLSDFKARWGGRRDALHYYYLPKLDGIGSFRHRSSSKRVMYHIMKACPPSISRLIGSRLYKYFI
jgi:predicted N-acyltransferase